MSSATNISTAAGPASAMPILEASEDAMAHLKKSKPTVIGNFSKLKIDTINFSREDNHARQCPAQEMTTIERLSRYLTSPFQGNQLSQLRTIFTWIAENIRYDVEGLLSGQYGGHSNESILISRIAICDEYANIFQAMGAVANLKIMKIVGFTRAIGDYKMNGKGHAWNAVSIDGQYFFVDPTWGSGFVNMDARSFTKQFKPFYFCTSPKRFIFSHWPENPTHQFLSPAIDITVFRCLPVTQAVAWTLGVKWAGKHRSKVVHATDDFVGLEIRLRKCASTGSIPSIMADLSMDNTEKTRASCQWIREDPKYVWMSIKFWCPSRGSGELSVFGWPAGVDEVSRSGEQCLSMKVYNESGTGQYAREMIKQFACKGFSFSIVEPLLAQVKQIEGVKQTVRVRVFGIQPGCQPKLGLLSPISTEPVQGLTLIEPNLFEIKTFLKLGRWKIAKSSDVSNSWNILAEFQAV